METGPRALVESRVRCPYELDGFYDEAFEPSGEPRPAYRDLIARVSAGNVATLSSALAEELDELGACFGGPGERTRFHVDPVPRVFEPAEWELLERGLRQRVRALGEFVADVYGERRAADAGIVPVRAIEGCEYFEPWMLGVPTPPWAYVAVAGIDLVRCGDGRWRVLEDNLRTPSGLAYASAARHATDEHLPGAIPSGRRALGEAYDALGAALRAAAPDGRGDPSIVLISDGEANSAWFEHRTLARKLDIPLVRPDDLHIRSGTLHARVDGSSREVHVLYRRTDADRLRDDDGRATWLAELLLDQCRAGRLACVNAFGSGVADDKLIHAYVDRLVEFYLGEEPLLESVRAYDLADPVTRQEVLERVDELVLKPRWGHGGHGIFVGPHAKREDRHVIARRVAENPEDWIAQETVALSRLPVIEGTELVPRHVDLRAFVISAGETVTVAPGGLTRFAPEEGSLVVNSSQGGGGKDTWVLS